MLDSYGREIDYMRISVTDRCNLRCRYCMPNGIDLLPRQEILTYEEIESICRVAAENGIRKLKVTGGEPLVRKGCAEFIGRLKRIPGIEQVTLTTNGILLGQYAESLAENGLDAVNISLDSLNRETYRQITGFDELDQVLESLETILRMEIPAKINVVLQKGVNDKEWKPFVRLAEKYPVSVRFIEMMPIGFGKQFEPISNETLLEMLQSEFPGMTADEKTHGNGPAVYYKIPGYQGSIGFISAIHGKFCENCNRMRLTSLGQLKPCLCYGETCDLRKILRDTEENKTERMEKVFREAVQKKPKQHCFEKESEITEEKNMIQIGG